MTFTVDLAFHVLPLYYICIYTYIYVLCVCVYVCFCVDARTHTQILFKGFKSDKVCVNYIFCAFDRF